MSIEDFLRGEQENAQLIADLRSTLDTRDDEFDFVVNRLDEATAKLEAAESENEKWTHRAVDMTGNLANFMLENNDLKDENKLLKERLAFFEDGLEQLRKLFKPSGENVKPVNAHEFATTVYRRVVKTIGEAPSADPTHRLFPPQLPV